MAGWAAGITDRLAELKRSGVPFDQAWAVAVIEHPPRPRELGVSSDGTLLSDAAAREAVEWFRLRCEDAWEGRQPALRGLAGAIERVGYTMPTSNVGRHRDMRSVRVG